MIRQPAVAGSFYPADPSQLSNQLIKLVRSEKSPAAATAIIVPHAGYVYSGAVAGEVIAATKIPKTVVMLGPNHQGVGQEVAVSAADGWATPLGEVPVNTVLREKLCQSIPSLQADERAHQLEHSLEVMLPLLLQCRPDLEIVPISLRTLDLAGCLQLGSQIASALSLQDEEVLLLASSDMNHFLDADTTEKLDFMAIDAMTGFDPERLYQVVMDNRISMCGVLPAVVVMQAAKELGATHCQLVRHTHSGEINGDTSRVVGYASLSIS